MPELYQHQLKIINESPNKHLLAWSCGTGKTATAIKWADKKNLNVLVICPKSLVDNWHREINKWSIKGATFTVVSKEQFKSKYKNILTNINGLIIDEIHNHSGYKSQLYKATIEFIKVHNIQYVLGLTATPYRSTPFNVFCLANILGRNLNWFSFNNLFFTMIKRGPRKWPVLKKDINGVPVKEYIGNMVKSLGSVVSMSEVVDVPEHVWIREDFVINTEQKKACGELLDSTAIARLSKVFQILNGSLKSDGYSEDKYFKCDKFNRALELIEENDKIAVICRHTLELQRFRNTIKDRRVFILNGETPKEERDKLIQEFNNSEKCVILINAKVAEGYNLYTPVMMFYSMDWGLVEWTQMIGRPVRLDNLKSVVYINLVYKDTVDNAVYDNVVIKKQEFNAEIYNKNI